VTYRVKEIFLTLQGEGMRAGTAAVFCRFSGCNLWNGHEASRSTATCRFCDTDFLGTDGPGGGTFASASQLAESVRRHWGDRPEPGWVVCTGGEPLLQLDGQLVREFHEQGLLVAVETNGTRPLPAGLDWVCVSPKAGAPLVVSSGDELKLVFPQDGAPPEAFEHLGFRHRLIQPMDGPDRDKNTLLAVQFCLTHPGWRLSLQTHKYLGIP
jgi:7-carboxy-7-deazaguanine synthase (Cx14CxxC type)